eukprot:GILK01004973.1.p1 GENE.GILK01004973.1~~GILK01004973.1.p1  ORF type:complete len:922 (-),score=134.53 GILK01004973.1:303-3020(-)
MELRLRCIFALLCSLAYQASALTACQTVGTNYLITPTTPSTQCPLSNNQRQVYSTVPVVTSICSRYWRIRNPNNCGLTFDYQITNQGNTMGSGFAPGNTDTYVLTNADGPFQFWVDWVTITTVLPVGGSCNGAVASSNFVQNDTISAGNAAWFKLQPNTWYNNVPFTIYFQQTALYTTSPTNITWNGSYGNQYTYVSVIATNDQVSRPVTPITVLASCDSSSFSSPVVSLTGSSVMGTASAGATVLPSAVSVIAGLTTNYTFTLSSVPDSTVTVNIATSASGLTFSPSVLTFNPAAVGFSKSQTVTISAASSASAGTVSVSHTVTSSDTKYNGLTVSALSVNVSAAAASVAQTVTCLTSSFNTISPGESAWLSASFSTSAYVDFFYVTVSGLPSGSSLVYPSDGSRTSLYKGSFLRAGEVDYVAFKVVLPFTTAVGTYSATLNVSYRNVNGATQAQTVTVSLPVSARAVVPFTLSSGNYALTRGTATVLLFTFSATSAVSNFKVTATVSASNISISYPSNRAYSQPSQDTSINAATVDYVAISFEVPSVFPATTIPITLSVSYTDTTARTASYTVTASLQGGTTARRLLAAAGDDNNMNNDVVNREVNNVVNNVVNHVINVVDHGSRRLTSSVSLVDNFIGYIASNRTSYLAVNIDGSELDSATAVLGSTPDAAFIIDSAVSHVQKDSNSRYFFVFRFDATNIVGCYTNFTLNITTVDGVTAYLLPSLCSVGIDFEVLSSFADSPVSSDVVLSVPITALRNISEIDWTVAYRSDGTAALSSLYAPTTVQYGEQFYLAWRSLSPSAVGSYTYIITATYIDTDTNTQRQRTFPVSLAVVTPSSSEDNLTTIVLAVVISVGGMLVLATAAGVFITRRRMRVKAKLNFVTVKVNSRPNSAIPLQSIMSK